ncbi:MAG: ABC transporter permease subunit [Clostridia bacterium]|nr:ABC transporter permease subunit [Clostridia bacterium]
MIKSKQKLLNLILTLISIGAIFIVWGCTAIAVGKEYVLPTISSTLKEFARLFVGKRFYVSFAGTLLRSLIAFTCSFLLAFLCAYFAQKHEVFKSLISPIISVVRALPTIAVVLLLLFWTNEFFAPIIVTMLVVFPTVFSQLKIGFESIDKSIKEAAMVDGANDKLVFKYIEIPLILPTIYSTMGGGFALNVKLMVAAEVLSATPRSIGGLLNSASYNSELAYMLAIVCVSVILGVIIELIFNSLSKKASNWK